ncbi:hypothetical protein Tco_1107096, partial [Tanacetum coccineum]
KKEQSRSLALKVKKEVSDEDSSSSDSEDEECGDPNHFIGECSKPPKNTDQRAFIGGVWSDNEKMKKQTALAISTTEAEYGSAGKACQQALWMKQALIDYGISLDNISIMCNNKGAIDLSKNPVQHSRTKQIEIRHHFLRDNVQKGDISLEKVSSEDNIADILTKPLKRKPFNYLCLGLGMMEQID